MPGRLLEAANGLGEGIGVPGVLGELAQHGAEVDQGDRAPGMAVGGCGGLADLQPLGQRSALSVRSDSIRSASARLTSWLTPSGWSLG
jgi:hypothetical protein